MLPVNKVCFVLIIFARWILVCLFVEILRLLQLFKLILFRENCSRGLVRQGEQFAPGYRIYHIIPVHVFCKNKGAAKK